MRSSIGQRMNRMARALLVAAMVGVAGACASFGADSPSLAGPGGAAAPDGGMLDGPNPVQGGPPITLSYNGPPLILAGESADLLVTVQRDGEKGFSGLIRLALGTTTGVSAPEVDIPAEQESATMKLAVSPTRKHGRLEVPILAASPGTLSKGAVTYPVLIRGPVGSVDTSFGVDGVFSLGEASTATGLVVGDEKIYVGGSIGTDLGVISLTKEGVLDPSYGAAGIFRANVGTLLSTQEMIGSTQSVYFGATIGGGASSAAVLVSVTAAGKPNAKFGTNGVAPVPLQSASTLAFSPPTALPSGILVGGRKDAASADSQVVIVQSDGTLSSLWGSNGVLSVSNDCPGGPSNEDCVPRGLVVASPGASLRICSYRHGGSIIGGRQYDDSPLFADISTSPFLNRCTSMALGGSTMFVAGEAGGVAGVVRYVGSQVDNAFAAGGVAAPTATAPAGSGLTLARKVLVQGDGTLVVGSDAMVAGHGAFGAWRILANGKTDTAFAPPNGFTTKSVGTTDVVVAGIGIDKENRLVVAGSNGHMVATRFWQ